MIASFVIGTFLVRPVGKRAGAMSSARGMCAVEVQSGRVLYEQNADAEMPMASTTKIATAIAVIENVEDLDEVVEVDNKSIGIEGTSIYLQKGEKLTVRELLLGLMLRSGNDCSVALALHVSPSVAEFSEKMQEVSEKAGATNSGYKNPHGLDEEGHYTTARDLALLTAYAMRNEEFKQIVATKSAKISGVEYPRVMQNKNRLLNSLEGCNGVKTGFTKKAGRCYVGSREYDGMTVVCIVLNCGPMFEETEAILKRAAEEFKMREILKTDEVIENKGIAIENFSYPLRESEEVEIKFEDDKVIVRLDDKEIYKGEYNKVNFLSDGSEEHEDKPILSEPNAVEPTGEREVSNEQTSESEQANCDADDDCERE
jgi:D-alanyl-D-alanine carboxypeptidase (penicillin-binding protein 5/6)